MEPESQPEPVPLGVVNKMLEKELSVRVLNVVISNRFLMLNQNLQSRRSRKRVRSRLQWVPLVTVAVPRE